MVPNTSDDLPDPEIPVKTVSRRLGISRLTSFRLLTRAPWTRIRSWRSAGCSRGEAMARSCHRNVRLHTAAVHRDFGTTRRMAAPGPGSLPYCQPWADGAAEGGRHEAYEPDGPDNGEPDRGGDIRDGGDDDLAAADAA